MDAAPPAYEAMGDVIVGKIPDALDYDERQIMQIWESFISGDTHATMRDPAVRKLIMESWARSISNGVNSEAIESELIESEEKLVELRQASRELWAAASGFFERVGSFLEGSGAMIALCDCSGVILETVGDPKTLDQGEEISLQVGGVWNESVIGTNGIGTALRTGAPVYVHGAEHFSNGIKSWTCAGAPIRDPVDQSIIGAIDLSGPPSIFQLHNSAFVAAAAGEIEEALVAHQRQRRLELLEAFLDRSPPRRADDPTLILDRHGRIIYRRNIPKNSDHAEDLVIGRRLAELDDATSDADIATALADKIDVSGIDIVHNAGQISGVALTLATGKDRDHSKVSSAMTKRSRVNSDSVEIVGRSEALLQAVDLAKRAANANASVLVQGETGVGKELFARLVHAESSGTRQTPFVAVNCGALSKELIGSELFGYAPGAFTGASREGKPGKLELAHGGVLCLDEIGEMPLDMQPFLLRVLEQRAVYRIGEHKRRPVELRLLSLTNRDLRVDCEQGTFRRDLYYRIATVVIRVPPLRERPEDIQCLINYFSQKIAAETDRVPLRFDDGVLDALYAYDWPGNVRELKNVIETLYFVTPNYRKVTLEEIPKEITSDPGKPAVAEASVTAASRMAHPAGQGTMQEEDVIRQALRQTGGNITAAAKALGISRPTLYKRMRNHNIRDFVKK